MAPSVEAPASPAPPAVDRRRTDTRDRIIESSLRLFADKGYAGTSVAEIERSVGLRPGSGGLYRHFASKDELLLAVVQDYRRRVLAFRAEVAARRRGTTAADLERDLRALVLHYGRFLSGEASIIRLRLETEDLPEPVRRTMAGAWDEGYGVAADLFVHHGAGPRRARVLAVAAIGSLYHYFSQHSLWHQRPGGVSPQEFLDAWVEEWGAGPRSTPGPGKGAGTAGSRRAADPGGEPPG